MHEDVPSSRIPVRSQLLVIAVVLLLLLGGATTARVVAYLSGEENTAPAAVASSTPYTGINFTSEELTRAYAEVRITGKAAYVWDVNGQQALYAKNESEVLPLASLTKLMTALVASELLSPDDIISVGPAASRQESALGLAVGSTFSRETLTDLVLMASANDGAFALANAAGNVLVSGDGPRAFVTAMNIRAEELGLTSTTFNNPTGLDVSTREAGGYGSARDVAFLMEYLALHEPDILALTKDSTARVWSESGDYIDAENTNFYIDEIPGLIGSKTGYTDLAGGNLTVAYDAGLGRPVIVVVLGSTQYARFTDVMTLVEATNKLIAHTTP
jgi:D-alanyl-D-alanine carboxypeptidase